MNNKLYIIAEAGVNHNGSLSLAKKLIDKAKSSGADAVKFQTWKKGELTGSYTKNVSYIKKNLNIKTKRSDLSDKLQLTYDDFISLQKYSKKKGITFLTTPDGFESLNFVSKVLKLPYIKIGSTELNHSAFLLEAAKQKIPLIVSTGMSNLEEIRIAVNIIKKHQKNFTILHCTSEYPVISKNANILSIKFLKDKLNVSVGFSDHTLGNTASVIAIGLGASIIEKHLTLDNDMEGPDHKMSLNPKQFKDFVDELRIASELLGSYKKEPTTNEIKSIPNIRRGVVASRDLKKNTTIKKDMIIAKRPFLEIEPNQIKKIIGRKLLRNLKKDQPIKWIYLQNNNAFKK